MEKAHVAARHAPKRQRARRRARRGSALASTLVKCAVVLLSTAACVMVRPEQRAVLADPIMQFGEGARSRAALEHALENREGSAGGGPVEGGGCGCN